MRKYFTIFIKITPKQVTKNQIYVKEHGYVDDIVFKSSICSASMIPPESAYFTRESKLMHWSKSKASICKGILKVRLCKTEGYNGNYPIRALIL